MSGGGQHLLEMQHLLHFDDIVLAKFEIETISRSGKFDLFPSQLSHTLAKLTIHRQLTNELKTLHFSEIGKSAKSLPYFPRFSYFPLATGT